MDSLNLTSLLIWYMVFLFSSSLHEASHALVSAYGGDYTAYRAGQATLNPIPHMQREKFGMIVMPLLSFFLNHGQWMIGWASAPFNPFWAARHPKRSFLMSLAGPLSHLIPTAISFIIIMIGLRTSHFALVGGTYLIQPVADNQPLVAALCMILGVMFQLNLILMIFNLLPFPPLDGSEVIYLFIKSEEERLRWRHYLASYSLAGVLLAWYVFPKIFIPIYYQLLRILSFAAANY